MVLPIAAYFSKYTVPMFRPIVMILIEKRKIARGSLLASGECVAEVANGNSAHADGNHGSGENNQHYKRKEELNKVVGVTAKVVEGNSVGNHAGGKAKHADNSQQLCVLGRILWKQSCICDNYGNGH